MAMPMGMGMDMGLGTEPWIKEPWKATPSRGPQTTAGRIGNV